MPASLTARDIEVLQKTFDYGIVTTNQIACVLTAPKRSMRRCMARLFQQGLLKRTDMLSFHGGSPTPAYTLSKDAVHFLAQHYADDRYFKHLTKMPGKQFVPHSVAVSDTHIIIDQAIASQNRVTLDAWWHEQQNISSIESTYKTIGMDFGIPAATKGRITCFPDFVCQMSLGTQSCLFLGEEDRDSYWAKKFCARKEPGYKRLLATKYHRIHFDQILATVPELFRIMVVTPTPARRDAIRRAAATMFKNDPPVFRSLWRFASKTGPDAMTADSCLHGKIWYTMDEAEAQPLITIPTVGVTGSPGHRGHLDGHLETAHVNAN